MGRSKIKVSIEKWAIAQQLAGKDASKEDIAKYYLDASLAKHIAQFCSTTFFVHLHEKSEFHVPIVVDEPSVEDYGITYNDFKKASGLRDILKIIGGISGVVACALLVTEYSELSFWESALLSICGPGIVLGFVFSALLPGIYLSFSGKVKKCIEYCKAIRGYSQNQIDFWKNLTWREFEIEIANYFEQMGFKAYVTKGSGDRGIDVVLKIESHKILVQCKQYKKAVGPNIVREMIGTLVKENANMGIIIALSGFSQGAYNTALGSNVWLWDIEDLVGLGNEKLRSKFSLYG